MTKPLIAFLFLSAFMLCTLFFLFGSHAPLAPDMVSINDAVMTAIGSGSQTEAAALLTEHLTQSYAAMNAAQEDRDKGLLLFLCILVAVYTAAAVLLYLYCHQSILKPFRTLRRFAQNVAAGNLDIPLAMDRHSRFGAFTESFDLMREELHKARENERRTSQSKKELVASLSHDIKTPIASIKAVTELMQVKSPDSAGQLDIILSKADQIDLLITDLFHATLEELEQLKVDPAELPSSVLYEIIQNADYNRQVTPMVIPQCIMTADKARLQQVFDNIISNSYKYAGTKIDITAFYEGAHLAVQVSDSGPGVADEELPLILEKFYRGAGAAGKSGSGLGLYIAKHLMHRMGGGLQCEQNEKGFAVKILLAM